MASDKPDRAAPTEIEVTPKMIAAGLEALFRWDDALRDDECMVEAIYRAMVASQPTR
jgi:hypothetical protein